MSVAVAYQVSPTGESALLEAVREADRRDTELDVLHVMEALDLDIAEATKAGISDTIATVLAKSGVADVHWELKLVTGESDVADAILGLAKQANAETLVIGARRRSPVGKFLLGSVTQSIILDADIPVLVVKS